MSVPATGDIVDVLIAQHQELLDALDEVRRCEGAPRADAFARFDALLSTHEQGEREVVHPVARELVDDPETVLDRVREEQAAHLALAELRDLDPDGAEFDAALREFRDRLIAHIGWEERVELPCLRARRTAEQLRVLVGELRTVQAMH
jgi:hypothetical protein